MSAYTQEAQKRAKKAYLEKVQNGICVRMICVIKLAQAGVLSKQLICIVTERMECAACELAMRSGLI